MGFPCRVFYHFTGRKIKYELTKFFVTKNFVSTLPFHFNMKRWLCGRKRVTVPREWH